MNMEWKRCLVIDGEPHATIEEAREAMLTKAFKDQTLPGKDALPCEVAKFVVRNREAIMEALSFTAKSRPGARGKTKTKKPSNGVALRNVPAQADLVLQKDA